MKIALLNLPVDNNYGGHLQRYALIKTLQKLGHTVTHLKLLNKTKLPWYKMPYSYTKRIILKYIFKKRNIHIFHEQYINNINSQNQILSNLFYEKYIPHTKSLYSIRDIKAECLNKYDVYIVGSDQVWRKSMTKQIGLKNYLFHFIKTHKVKRLAYAISLGSDLCEFSNKDIKELSPLYNSFEAVSVREISALTILQQCGWNFPKAQVTLDPTLLLSSDEYDYLIKHSNSQPYTQGKIYSYILDLDKKKRDFIHNQGKEKKLDYIIEGLNTSNNVSIEQWLCNIKNASMVITDSYHGTVFSIIFMKPFIFLGNKRRGNTRIESLFSLLNINPKDTITLDGEVINKKINELREVSLSFFDYLKE